MPNCFCIILGTLFVYENTEASSVCMTIDCLAWRSTYTPTGLKVPWHDSLSLDTTVNLELGIDNYLLVLWCINMQVLTCMSNFIWRQVFFQVFDVMFNFWMPSPYIAFNTIQFIVILCHSFSTLLLFPTLRYRIDQLSIVSKYSKTIQVSDKKETPEYVNFS